MTGQAALPSRPFLTHSSFRIGVAITQRRQCDWTGRGRRIVSAATPSLLHLLRIIGRVKVVTHTIIIYRLQSKQPSLPYRPSSSAPYRAFDMRAWRPAISALVAPRAPVTIHRLYLALIYHGPEKDGRWKDVGEAPGCLLISI